MYKESSVGDKGKSEDDQEGIHNDEDGRDDDDDDGDGNHGNYNNDYKVPRLQQVQQQCNNITKRKDNMLQIIHFYFYFTILQHRINNNKYNKKS